MSDSKLISFFNEMSNITEFERKIYIYELTNNLDIDLLFDLKGEYELYKSALLEKIKLQSEINAELVSVPVLRDLGQREARKRYIDTHLKNSKHTVYKVFEKESNRFSYIIDDLIRRKISDLPKNARQRNNYNFHFNYKESDEIIDMYTHYDGNESEESQIAIDLSDTSIIGKVVYLQKLGVVDYLRTKQPFSTSVNSIATILSAITGAKSTSIQPLLNPLLSKDVHSKNNPLNSLKVVYSVENILINMGFEFDKNK